MNTSSQIVVLFFKSCKKLLGNGFTERFFADFSYSCLREGFDKFNSIRDFICRQSALSQKCFKLCGFWGFIPGNNEHTRSFAKKLIRHGDHCRIMDSRMRQQMIFYLFSRNLFSSTVNLILRPAFNDNIAVSCQPDDITRTVKPSSVNEAALCSSAL